MHPIIQSILFIGQFVFLIFCYRRALVYLRYFQQEEYDAVRFLNWIKLNTAFDKRGTFLILCSLAVCYLGFAAAAVLFFAAGGLYLAFYQKDPRKEGKIKLNMTARASRIFWLAALLFLLFFVILVRQFVFETDFTAVLIADLAAVHFIPLSIILANLLLFPLEKWTKNRYKNQAKRKLKKISPYVIGITGSYGKTSVKAALGEVLNNTLAPTFCPPKSINTEMGITREIRENMHEGHKYAVIEMGAYNVGSIDRLCRLTPPNAAIVTVVGMAHLERYGSLERVYQAKSELPKWVPREGILVCNGDDPGARRMAAEFPKETTLLYGIEPEKGKLDCTAGDIKFSLDGTNFKLNWQGKDFNAFTKLLGRPALSNLIGVFTMACALGADPEFVIASIRNIKPVDNRLSLSKEGGVYFLRDAYNSNPAGFEAALDVLYTLPAKRKILMTPGMVELGPKQFEENKKAANKASQCCDLVILVGDTNLSALEEGLKEGGLASDKIIVCKSREESFARLNSLITDGDMILIENDLPDLYEVAERF